MPSDPRSQSKPTRLGAGPVIKQYSSYIEVRIVGRFRSPLFLEEHQEWADDVRELAEEVDDALSKADRSDLRLRGKDEGPGLNMESRTMFMRLAVESKWDAEIASALKGSKVDRWVDF